MKNIIKGIALTGVAALALTACQKEYLDTKPEDSVAPATIFETTENAKLAINGIAKMMTTQYLGSQGMNGEGTIKTWYGNYPGNDFQKCNLTGWSSIINGADNYRKSATTSYGVYPWFYYYKLIGNVNTIIVNIDNAAGSEREKAFIKAQALTYRAYSYFMLSQLYCRRWVDTNNGEDKDGLPLRLDNSTGDLALSTVGQVYDRIYTDLDSAIILFDYSNMERGEDEFYLPNMDVANAVYARAALTREDWATAAEKAKAARANYSLMSSAQYHSGFNTPNDEWIWGVYEADDQTLYYYSYFAYQGANSSASICRSYPCAISKELYDLIPDTDTRKDLFLAPTAEELADSKYTASSGRSTGLLYNRAFAQYGNKLYETSYVFAYMQFKQLASFMPGGGCFHLFRAAEMYLTEAEADCHLGKDAEAQKLLQQVNANHDASYTCTKTGSALLEEVKLYRRFDLWGEGNDWYDYKRWNQPIVRKTAADGGSFHQTFAITVGLKDSNEWRWTIPQKETDYNKLIVR